MNEIELSAGTLQYVDSGTDGPVVVLLHGLLMDASLWDDVIADLSTDHRCIAPTLPLGAHRRPMSPDADLSLPGIAGLVAEFLDRLDLHDVVLVGNDTGGAVVQLVLRDGAKRVGRAVLASCEAFDNLPPGLTGKTLALSGKLSPGLFGAFMQQLRVRAVRRTPLAFGTLTKRGDAVTARWIRPVLEQPEIRAETVRMLRAVFADRNLLVETAPELAHFDKPALVVWASEDRVMPLDHGRRLAELLPQAQFAEVADSYTLMPLDQPAEFAGLIREFVRGRGASAEK
ncbi:alpha/beta fold hydrolase [Kribbella kalugense]|uniref:Pimeloyl-ACP methyl ester carboxylesterase n=1 Tax=Kribbella kalugense TaxID=2512221 RepID=A0A4R7ZKM4_9ACTN|nr:alpha/beta hydrolase [Kribbella kalugense]TDW17915.1 pimeloyl-ACP methyl ester carboxylesterase [Kribbella kalugense]